MRGLQGDNKSEMVTEFDFKFTTKTTFQIWNSISLTYVPSPRYNQYKKTPEMKIVWLKPLKPKIISCLHHTNASLTLALDDNGAKSFLFFGSGL